MEKYAFKMKLNPGMEAEYRKRHDEIWPELVALLKDAGISWADDHRGRISHSVRSFQSRERSNDKRG